ncbi:hypothetical protein CPB97_005336, partial [Podila verticillata]
MTTPATTASTTAASTTAAAMDSVICMPLNWSLVTVDPAASSAQQCSTTSLQDELQIRMNLEGDLHS